VKSIQKPSFLGRPPTALFSAAKTPVQNLEGFGRFVNPIATTSCAEACQPTFLPSLATYHGLFQLDPVRVLPRQLLRFQTLTFRVIQGFHQGVRGVRSAHCAHTTYPNHPVKLSSGSDCLFWPLIYDY
jgi:hypothetical protein